jgi:hypothetical protein
MLAGQKLAHNANGKSLRKEIDEEEVIQRLIK